MSPTASKRTTTQTQGQSKRWKPQTSRLESLMSIAREQAELDVDCRELFKSLSPDAARSSKAITKRQKTCKRCAEVFRSQFQFYTVLLEGELSEEMKSVQSTKEDIHLPAEEKKKMLQRIGKVQNLKAKSRSGGSQRFDQFSSIQSSEGFVSEQTVLESDKLTTLSGQSSLLEMGGEYFFEETMNTGCLVSTSTSILDDELMPGSPISSDFPDVLF